MKRSKKIPDRYRSTYISRMAPTIIVTDREVIKDGRTIPSQQLFNNRDRVRADSGPRHNKTPIGLGSKTGVRSTWLQSPEDDTWRHRHASYLRRWASEAGRGHGIEEFHCVMHPTMRGNYKYFFFATTWFWVEYSDNGEVLRQSIDYCSKDSLMRAFKSDVIKWLT